MRVERGTTHSEEGYLMQAVSSGGKPGKKVPVRALQPPGTRYLQAGPGCETGTFPATERDIASQLDNYQGPRDAMTGAPPHLNGRYSPSPRRHRSSSASQMQEAALCTWIPT